MARGADVPFPPAFPSIFSFPASVSAVSQSTSQNRQEPRSKMREKQTPTNLVNFLLLPVYFGLALCFFFVKVFERVWMDSMDAARVIWHGTTAVVWKWVMQGPGSNNGALLVNASVTYGNTGKVINPVQVVDL